MEKIKCVKSINGILIPIHNISLIGDNKYIWSNADGENSARGHKLSDEQYNSLLKELEIIGD